MSQEKNKPSIIERLIFKMTSGRFIFTIVVAFVYAYLACSGVMPDDRVNEITLIVLYAYFNRPRIEVIDKTIDKKDDEGNDVNGV